MKEIIITLNDGKSTTGYLPSDLFDADKSKEVSLVFDTGEVYSGYLKEVNDEEVHLGKPALNFGVALPNDRLIAWFYKEDFK